jgi:hypothetical protein
MSPEANVKEAGPKESAIDTSSEAAVTGAEHTPLILRRFAQSVSRALRTKKGPMYEFAISSEQDYGGFSLSGRGRGITAFTKDPRTKGDLNIAEALQYHNVILHEAGHDAYSHVLSGEDQAKFLEWLAGKDIFDSSGVISQEKVLKNLLGIESGATGGTKNMGEDAHEIFAELFSTYVMHKIRGENTAWANGIKDLFDAVIKYLGEVFKSLGLLDPNTNPQVASLMKQEEFGRFAEAALDFAVLAKEMGGSSSGSTKRKIELDSVPDPKKAEPKKAKPKKAKPKKAEPEEAESEEVESEEVESEEVESEEVESKRAVLGDLVYPKI